MPNRRKTARVVSEAPAARRSIPEFRSEAEERAFWETRDTADYVDWTTSVTCRIRAS